MAITNKARLRARLTELFPKASRLKAERLDALAAKLQSTDESTDEEVDNELTTINDSGFNTFEEIVVEDDRVANLLKKRPRIQKPETKKEEEDQDDAEPLTPLEKRLKELEYKLAQKEEQEARQNLANKFKSDKRLKNVPASWVKNNLPASEDDYESNVEALVEEFQQFSVDHKLQTFGGDTPPAGGKPKGGKVEEVSKEEADAVVSSLLGNAR